MRRAAPFALLAALLVLLSAACKAGPTDTGRSPDPTTRKDPPKDPQPQKEAPPMTDLDPKSPAAWMQAAAVAATAARGKVQKHSDALPFLFKADDPPYVLVHKGQVVRDKGVKVAGEYLRDLGIVENRGPAIADVLVVLAALDALPPVPGVPKESYVHAPGDKALSDITARLYVGGGKAKITLVYFLSGPLNPERGGPAAPGDTVGGKDPDYRPKPYRKIAECQLIIPRTGDPTWTIEHMNWTQE